MTGLHNNGVGPGSPDDTPAKPASVCDLWPENPAEFLAGDSPSSVHHVAEILTFSGRHVRCFIQHKKLPSKNFGRAVRVRRRDVAHLMTQAMRKLAPTISNSNTVVIFINQIRHKIGVIWPCRDLHQSDPDEDRGHVITSSSPCRH